MTLTHVHNWDTVPLIDTACHIWPYDLQSSTGKHKGLSYCKKQSYLHLQSPKSCPVEHIFYILMHFLNFFLGWESEMASVFRVLWCVPRELPQQDSSCCDTQQNIKLMNNCLQSKEPQQTNKEHFYKRTSGLFNALVNDGY